jgi:hypothetical protein
MRRSPRPSADPDFVKKTAGQGLDFAPGTPAEFSATIVQEFKNLDRVLKPSSQAREGATKSARRN